MNISDRLNAFMDLTWQSYDMPGFTAGLSMGRDILFTASRGYRDCSSMNTEAPALLKAGDIFHCGSVSKTLTACAVMKLVEADRGISLYSTLPELLPDLPFADSRYENIRLWNLLSHTSGLGDCHDYRWYAPELDADALRRYVYSDEVCSQPMLWQPQPYPQAENGRFSYSNVAYEILGHIASEYSDRIPECQGRKFSYEELIDRIFFRPLGMSSSSMLTFERDDWGTAAMARPHSRREDGSLGLISDYPYNRAHAPSSTLTTNAGDLLKWGQAHLPSCSSRSRVFPSSIYDLIWSHYALVPNNGEHMGLGWFCRKQTVNGNSGSRNYTLYGHEGTDDGFRASLWICPELDLVSVVLSNMSGAPVKRINKALFAAAAALLD